MSLSRRSFGLGVLGALAAPAIIRTPGLLMPVKALIADDEPFRILLRHDVLRPGVVDRWGAAYNDDPRQWVELFFDRKVLGV